MHILKYSFTNLYMQFIQGNNREQSILFPDPWNRIIEQDNEVRIIDIFMDSINPEEFKFIIKPTKEERPAYYPKDLLKLLVYAGNATVKICEANI